MSKIRCTASVVVTMDQDDRHCRDNAEASGAMGVPHITSFCWCFGLEVGTKCVGFLHLIASLVLLVICSLFAKNAGDMVGTVEDMDHLYSTAYKVSCAVAVGSLVHVVLAVTLLVSVIKRNTTGLRVWVIVMSVLVCAALLSVIVMCALYGLSSKGSDMFLSFLLGLLFYGTVSYCILCVNSFYLMLKSSEDMEGPKSDY